MKQLFSTISLLGLMIGLIFLVDASNHHDTFRMTLWSVMGLVNTLTIFIATKNNEVA